MKKQGLNNPALIAAAASTPEGQKAISKGLETAQKGVSSTVSIVKGVLVIGVLSVAGYMGYNAIFNGFTKIQEDKLYTPANLSEGLAKSKAEVIYQAMKGAGNGFNTIKAVLQNVNGQRINHNGFIRIYNAFGKRAGFSVLPFAKKTNMVEWFNDQFDQSELVELRFIISNFF
jgi:hypothetical protein